MVAFDLRHLALLAPKARDTYRDAFARADVLAASGLLDSPIRLAHFLAQVCHETGGLQIVVENLNYTAERLMVVWPQRFPSLEVARLYAGNKQALAEKVYGFREELGNIEPGDGWRFIGRGLLQITGRTNYARAGTNLNIDLVGHPYLAASPEYALAVGLEMWRLLGADAPAERDDVVKVTHAINGGLTGLAERKAWLCKAKTVLGIA